MNTYDLNDQSFVNSEEFQKFMKNNPARGFLRIRAFAASGAVPISGLQVVVSTIIDNNRFIFFEGATNESGIIDNISLPAPRLNTNNLDVPSKTVYDIEATYEANNFKQSYQVNMYEKVFVVQAINVGPSNNLGLGEYNGS